MKINHAILHAFDFVSCENAFAQTEIDLHNKNAKKYVQSLANKCLNNLDNKHGEFSPESLFAPELRAYHAGERDFAGLSQQIAEFLAGELGHMEKTPSCDVLVVDFEVEPKMEAAPDSFDTASDSDTAPWDEEPAPTSSDEASFPEEAPWDEENSAGASDDSPTGAADAGANESDTTRFGDASDILAQMNKRYFAIILLESKQAYMHDLFVGETGTENTISRHFAILPNPSQKVQSAAVIDLRSQNVLFVDKKRVIAGQETYLIPDGLLQCSSKASTKEIVSTAVQIVEEVAQEYGANPAVATARVKDYVTECARDSRDFDIDEMADEVFGDQAAPRETIREYAQERELPQQVSVEKEVVKRVARTQKIRTDTGIEISFPAEYVRSPEFISFTSTADGTYSISLNNITSIENR
ncbi:MAG: nucleoid-associated protein [Coriobacteriia bacterium]|nr:nucleoid-associated protein [Coriobacteriia bacterium]